MRLTLLLLSAFLIVGLAGCGSSSTPTTVEAGSVQEFLDSNPDYVEEDAGSENEQFDAADDGE